MHWVYGVDSSFDELTLDEARRLKDGGVQVYAQCLWTGTEQPEKRVVSLRNAMLAGIPELIGYISVANNGQDGAWHVNMGRSGLPDDIWAALTKVPIDVELARLTMSTHVIPALPRIADFGKDKDIYTSYHAWVDLMGNPMRPAGTGLWNAIWDEHPDFDFPYFRYGGWRDEDVWGEQWSGGTNVEGQFADRNQFRASALGIAEPVPEPNTPVPVPPPSDKQWLTAAQFAAVLTLLFTTRQRPDADLRDKIKYLIQAQ